MNVLILLLFCQIPGNERPERDLRVAAFLGVAPLNQTELALVVEKCSFRYMQEHDDSFEMHPPHSLSADAELFVSGSADRHADAPVEVRHRIASWCADRMAGGRFPLARVYPDVTP